MAAKKKPAPKAGKTTQQMKEEAAASRDAGGLAPVSEESLLADLMIAPENMPKDLREMGFIAKSVPTLKFTDLPKGAMFMAQLADVVASTDEDINKPMLVFEGLRPDGDGGFDFNGRRFRMGLYAVVENALLGKIEDTKAKDYDPEKLREELAALIGCGVHIIYNGTTPSRKKGHNDMHHVSLNYLPAEKLRALLPEADEEPDADAEA